MAKAPSSTPGDRASRLRKAFQELSLGRRRPGRQATAAPGQDDPRASWRYMTRNARVVLIAGDRPDQPGTSTQGAADALDMVRGDLVARFVGTEVEIVR